MSGEKKLEAKTVETYLTEESALNNFKQGIVLQDGRGYVLAVDPTAAEILGLTAEQLIGCHSIEPLWQTIHEDGSPFEGETHPAMVALSTGKPCINVIMGFYRPSGELVWLKLDSQPLFQDSQAKPYAVVTTFSDLTERQAARSLRKQTEKNSTPIEQDLLLAISTSNDGFWNWNVSSKKVCFSSRWKQMRGYQDHEIGESEEEWLRNIHPDDRDRIKAAIEAHFTKKTPYFQEEYRVQSKNGSYIWILDCGQAFWNEDGNVVRMAGSQTDITKRKQVEQALELSERRNASLARLAPVGIFRSDRIGNCIYVNDCCCEMMGLSSEKSLGEGWARAVHPDDRDRVTSEWMQAVEKNLPFYSECRFLHGDGTIRTAIAQAIIETDEERQIIGYIGTLTDISDRKQAEVALRESERKYQTVFETIDEGFCVCEMLFDDSGKPIDYRFLEVNPAFEKMTGLERATGKTARELIPNLETSWFDIYGRVALTGEPVRFENQSIAMNRWFDVNAFHVGEPQSHKFGVLFTNITDRKSAEIKLRASEERLSLALEASGMATWDIDLKTDKAIWSERFFGILGYEFSLGGEATMKMWKSRVHPDDLPRVMQIMERAKEERSLYCPEYRIIRADNAEIVWLSSFGRFFYDEAGEVVRFSGVAFNNTERKRFETEREQLLKREQAAREEAERANRVKDEFLAILSHELRSPLNPILGWTQLLKTYKSDPKRLDQGLDTIERSAKLLLELIDDLLDVAKILRGKIALNLAPVNLVRAIEGALETVSAAASAKSIALETHLNPIGQVNGDLARLQQIFWNLLSNAVKFTNNGGKIEVRLSRVEDAAQITVSDNGKGIAPEFLPHVFEYFRQADSSITRKHGGLGLGLALVRHLVELHGGVVSVTSPGLGGGATFIVNLPLFKTKSDGDYSDGSNLELSKSQPDLTGVRILVVDDDPDNLEFLTMALQCYQANVVAVTSGYKALAIIEEFAPNILISDIAMPEMDGLTLIKSIRSRTPETKGTIPAIALSAYARESDREKAIAAGFQVHIPKPIDINVLAATILELLPN